MTDLRCERRLESAISRMAAAVATPSTILAKQRNFTPVIIQAMPEIRSCTMGDGKSITQPNPIEFQTDSIIKVNCLHHFTTNV